MIRPFIADLHVHTLLSPCAEIEMTPHHIVSQASRANIEIVAITDHNAADNVQAAIHAACGTNVHVLPGMEVETKEEVHVLVLFDQCSEVIRWQNYIARNLPNVKNNDEKFGAQFIVDHEDNLIAVKEQMLLLPSQLSLEEITVTAGQYGGIVIASHVDRPAYSILSQLGFIPPGVSLDAVELSRRAKFDNIPNDYPSIMNYPIITSSDAHTMLDFLTGPKTVFYIERPSLEEIKMALCGQQGRRVFYNFYLTNV